MQSPPLPLHWMAIIWTIWFRSGTNIEVWEEGGGKYCTRSWACIFHFEVSSHSTCFARHCELLTSSGIRLHRLHRWTTVNRPLADWCPTYQPLTLSLPSSNSTFSQPSKEKCMSDVVRIGSIIICQHSKLWTAKFFILCGVIFLVRLQGKFDIDHSWEWKG